jgi:hypothetical protein
VPTIVGPHMENFREIADAFLAGDALIRVAGEEELADRLTRFAADPQLFREVGRRAGTARSVPRASEASTDAVLSRFRTAGRGVISGLPPGCGASLLGGPPSGVTLPGRS